jgi:hypothetical protein
MLIGAQVSGLVFNSVVNGGSAELLKQWQSFWMLPAVFAGVIMLFFSIFFNEKKVRIVNSD